MPPSNNKTKTFAKRGITKQRNSETAIFSSFFFLNSETHKETNSAHIGSVEKHDPKNQPELTSLRKQAFLEIDCTTHQQFSENLRVMRQVFFEKLNPKPFSENAVGRRHQFSDKPHPQVTAKHPNTIAFFSALP